MKKLHFIKKCLFGNCNKPIRRDYKILHTDDINYFHSFLDENQIEKDNLDFYNIDWIKKYKGNSSLVVKPKSIQEVSKILEYCNKNKLAVVPQGGNTGLVGGSVPVFDEIIINMIKMNKIIEFNTEDNSIKCEAGCILQDLNDYIQKFNRVMPIDLGAKGSCLIGGNLSTNAGGIHFVKYGSLRNNCKSMTVVLPNGTVLNFDSTNKWDLKQLFIGAEGTLGIIVECEISTQKLYKNKVLSLLGLNSFNSVIELYQKAKFNFKEDLTAIEFFDSRSLHLLNYNLNIPPLFENNINAFPFYLLIEYSNHDIISTSAFDTMAEFLINNNFEENSLITDDPSKMNDLWKYREKIASACSKNGIVFKYDVSLPLTNFYKIVEDVRKIIGDLAVIVGYGHVGDYNLHINVMHESFKNDEKYYKIENLLEPYIFDYLKNINGSISAEHGIGLAKAKYLDRSQTLENIELMKRIKNSIDPNLIMNPYKMFI